MSRLQGDAIDSDVVVGQLLVEMAVVVFRDVDRDIDLDRKSVV